MRSTGPAGVNRAPPLWNPITQVLMRLISYQAFSEIPSFQMGGQPTFPFSSENVIKAAGSRDRSHGR